MQGSGSANPSFDDMNPLQQLKTNTYDPQIRYSTFQFTISPELAERLPIPGGYHDIRAVYSTIPDGRIEHVYALRYKGDA